MLRKTWKCTDEVVDHCKARSTLGVSNELLLISFVPGNLSFEINLLTLLSWTSTPENFEKNIKLNSPCFNAIYPIVSS